MRVKQMLLISSGYPKAVQGVIYYFWTGQNQPCLHSQRAIIPFEFKGEKCMNANEVNPQFSALGEEQAIQTHWHVVWKRVCTFNQIQFFKILWTFTSAKQVTLL